MVLEEVRRKVTDKQGREHNKLVCRALVEEDSIIIEIKNSDYKTPVYVSISSVIESYADQNMMDDVKVICKFIYEKLKNNRRYHSN